MQFYLAAAAAVAALLSFAPTIQSITLSDASLVYVGRVIVMLLREN